MYRDDAWNWVVDTGSSALPATIVNVSPMAGWSAEGLRAPLARFHLGGLLGQLPGAFGAAAALLHVFLLPLIGSLVLIRVFMLRNSVAISRRFAIAPAE